MTITAKFAGRCNKCHGHIAQGETIEWAKGAGASHVTCPTAATTTASPAVLLASVPGGAQAPAGRNRRAALCDTCGQHLPVGAGRLVRCYADTGCMQHFDDDGWHTYCLDGDACQAHATAAREAAKIEAEQRRAAAAAEKIAVAERLAAYRATRDQATAGLVALDSAVAEWRGGEQIAAAKDFYDLRLHHGTMRGYAVVIEYADSYDDNRVTLWAPLALADELLDEAAVHITMYAAREWLSHYRGCLGTEMYEYAAQRGE